MESDAFTVVDPQAQYVAAGLVECVVERRRTGNERRVDHAGEVSRGFSVGPFVDGVLPAFALHAELVEMERFGRLGVDGPVQTAHRDRGQLPVLLFVESVAGGQRDSAAERQQVFRKLFHGAFRLIVICRVSPAACRYVDASGRIILQVGVIGRIVVEQRAEHVAEPGHLVGVLPVDHEPHAHAQLLSVESRVVIVVDILAVLFDHRRVERRVGLCDAVSSSSFRYLSCRNSPVY